MKKLLIPLLLIILGVGGGAGAGFFLKPSPDNIADAEHDCVIPEEVPKTIGELPEDTVPEFVKLNNQFVVPVLQSGSVTALVVLSLSIEMSAGQRDIVFKREPKLRDVFNEVLFYHANTGGFDGVFTDTGKMNLLRRGLSEAASGILGDALRGVLITDIMRQES